MPTDHLTLDDILDARAYERARDDFRARVMARKRLRRVGLGEIMTVVFESVDTVRFQVQEMARVEKILTDEGIQAELDVYNQLLPAPGELSATLFIELTSDAALRHWLPRLVGVERAIAVELADGSAVVSVPEDRHAEALTRETVTPAVHYVRFRFPAAEVAAFAAGPVALAVTHPAYEARTELSAVTQEELLADLEGRTEPLPLG
jgi:phage baseplate assembly protein W